MAEVAKIVALIIFLCFVLPMSLVLFLLYGLVCRRKR